MYVILFISVFCLYAMTKVLKGLYLKSESFTGINKNKCKVLAMWGSFIPDNQDSESAPMLIKNDKKNDGVQCNMAVIDDAYSMETLSDTLLNQRIDNHGEHDDPSTPDNPNNPDDSDDMYICDHDIENTGFITVRRSSTSKNITWNDGQKDSNGKLLDDLELEWDKELRVYMSQNEYSDDDPTWVRVLQIV